MFKDESDYAVEELVAEISSCFTGADIGLQYEPAEFKNHKAYVQDVYKRQPLYSTHYDSSGRHKMDAVQADLDSWKSDKKNNPSGRTRCV